MNVCFIVICYVEVLFIYVEVVNEFFGLFVDVYDKLDLICGCVGMLKVDCEKYVLKEILCWLICCECGVELVGEGVCWVDILCWKDDNGKMVVEIVLNGVLERVVGIVNYVEIDLMKCVEIDMNVFVIDKKIEDCVFKVYN